MALFLSLHQAPGLSPEEIAGYGPDVAKGVYATFRQLYVNTDTGFIVSVYEADSAAAVEQEFERVGFPFDSINEIDFTLSAAELAADARPWLTSRAWTGRSPWRSAVTGARRTCTGSAAGSPRR